MVISEISIKNFKSYGNAIQNIKFDTDSGKLILLMGENGRGKSSFMESVEFSLYGKVLNGRKKKWTTLSTLPNRINRTDMEIGIKFYSNGTNVEILRGIAPNKLELFENGVLNDRAVKANLDDKIELLKSESQYPLTELHHLS
jgi:DNA repair exonuclease SbcCD ATPase subunit